MNSFDYMLVELSQIYEELHPPVFEAFRKLAAATITCKKCGRVVGEDSLSKNRCTYCGEILGPADPTQGAEKDEGDTDTGADAAVNLTQASLRFADEGQSGKVAAGAIETISQLSADQLKRLAMGAAGVGGGLYVGKKFVWPMLKPPAEEAARGMERVASEQEKVALRLGNPILNLRAKGAKFGKGALPGLSNLLSRKAKGLAHLVRGGS